MKQDDLLQGVEQARRQLMALRTRLESDGTASGSPETPGALGDLLEMLEKLHSHFALLREILARTSDVVFAKDTNGRYLVINPMGAAMFGKSVDEILGQDDSALFGRESAERIMAIDRGVMRTGTSLTFEETFDIRGIPITLLTTETAWYEPHGTLRGLIGTARDVTERNRSERGAAAQQKRLGSLASEIVIAEERLRQSLAADLHNGLGQDIALAKMKLSVLRSTSDAQLSDSLIRIENLVEQADRSLRSITFRLSPPSLHDLGLVPALEWLAENISERHGIEVRIEDNGTPAVTDERMRVILFRAVRELLVNAATHSEAGRVVVRLAEETGLMRISVEDLGVGFDAEEDSLRGYGLFGIREQLKHMGGSMQVASAPGRGTTVTLIAPLPNEIAAAS